MSVLYGSFKFTLQEQKEMKIINKFQNVDDQTIVFYLLFDYVKRIRG